MEEDTEYKKLPLIERCTHKLWKARVNGYEEAAKLFREIEDEKSPEWSKFVNLIKKFVVDSNAMAQEKGLEATLIFLENCGHADKTIGEVMSGVVQKCVAAPRTKTKELGVQVALMYIEIEKQDATIEELIKGMDHKNPKIVAACVSIATLALKEFGNKVIGIKPLIKKLAPLMSDRDKAVRDEGKQLAIEIYRWIGPAMKQQILTLPQVTISELENEFEKLKGEKAVPNRYLKSQEKQAISAAAIVDADNGDVDAEEEVGGEEIDPLDLIDPVDILSKLPKDFYDKLEAKKWQERKEALEALEKLLEHPKLENGDYGTLVLALKKVITKDTNVVLVAMAGKSMASLAKGLRKKFSTYATTIVPALLEKFKEKKVNVVTALREAIDAIYPSTTLEAIQESLVEALANKNPNVKAETASFLSRAFSKTQPTVLTKKFLKLIVGTLLKTLNEPDPTVRDNSAEAIGTLLKLVGEKQVGCFLSDVDALKMVKIKECQENAVILVKIAGIKKERPATAPAKTSELQKKTGGSTEPRPVTRPATGLGKKLGAKKTLAGPTPISKSSSTAKMLATEREMSPDEIAAKAEELFPADVLSDLVDSVWKKRFSAVENLLFLINDMDATTPGLSQTIVRTISGRKPGLKEMIFQVLKIKLDIIRICAEKFPFTSTTSEFVLNEITEKLADPKNGCVAAQVLTAIAEATKLEFTVMKVMAFAFEQKSPKVQSEALNWVNLSIKEFGFQINPKILIEDVRKAVQSSNPTIRGSGISLLGTMGMYMGQNLMILFDNEKQVLKNQIQCEIDKNIGQKPPTPTRGVKKTGNGSSVNDCEENGVYDAGAGGDEDTTNEINVADLLPRIDISSQLTESLKSEISDKNWKTRNEGLIKLQTILSEAKMIKPTIGDLPSALALRLVDSNAKIAQTALTICEQLATAIGPPCKPHVSILFPGFLHGLGDNKTFIRAGCLSCINVWGEQCGYKEFFQGEMIADALKTGSPMLKTELWGWIAEKLPTIPVKSISKEELASMLPHLYAHIIDRNAEVRKNANEAVLGVMIHLGYEPMVKAMDKQKPSAKKDIQAALDKARPNLPVKPLPKNKQQAPIVEETKKTNGNARTSKGPNKPVKESEKNSTARKKEEDVDTSPLLAVNNIKNQRLIDEQKLRVLKWTFTTPREEFTDLLREQMATGNVNKSLMANMFHDDFRYHLKAIEQLLEDLPNNTKALISNLDLILKWVSLRFYDTNPSVLLKGLDYLNLVFVKLVENEYVLAENEGSAFIPHLLTKIGDSKDSVRNGVRNLMRQIVLVYPFTKVFVYIMDGLKSKNARQRTECLDELGYLIETYGLSVCQPTQAVALKEIARHISDRDNSVRSAALNAVVQAYFLAGEKVYKLIGQLSDKDISMLEERIKRMKKIKKPTPPAVIEIAKAQTTAIITETIEIEEPMVNVHDEIPPPDEGPLVTSSQYLMDAYDSNDDTEKKPTLKRQATFDQTIGHHAFLQKPSGPFGLDPNVIAEIEKNWVRADQWAAQNPDPPVVDISLLFEPLKKPEDYPLDKFEQLISRSHYISSTSAQGVYNNYNLSPSQRSSSVNSSSNMADTLTHKLEDPNIIRIISSISNPDTVVARAAMNELTDIIDSTEKQAILRDYEELFIQNVLAQFKNLSQQPICESIVVYQPLLSITFSFFNTKVLGRTLNVQCLKSTMAMMLGLMADQKLSIGDDGQYTKVINGICLKILDKTNFTNLNCALIRLLKETCSSAGLPKFTDLLMKCIWRNVKTMPERSNELDYDAVLYEVHVFMTTLPSAWWQQRPSDTPLRTVKTIIHNMAKIKGNSILQSLNKIPPNSELHLYVLKILKNLQNDGQPGMSPQRSASVKDMHSKRISNQSHEAIKYILNLISDKETGQQGLLKLYEFKAKNPDIDITAFFKGANPEFQKYINDGLVEIERRQHSIGDNKVDSTVNVLTSNGETKEDPDFWMDRLNHLMKANRNYGNSRNLDSNHMIDNKETDENLNLNQIPQKVSHTRKDKVDIPPNRLEHLQAKLMEIKSQRQS